MKAMRVVMGLGYQVVREGGIQTFRSARRHQSSSYEVQFQSPLFVSLPVLKQKQTLHLPHRQPTILNW